MYIETVFIPVYVAAIIPCIKFNISKKKCEIVRIPNVK